MYSSKKSKGSMDSWLMEDCSDTNSDAGINGAAFFRNDI